MSLLETTLALLLVSLLLIAPLLLREKALSLCSQADHSRTKALRSIEINPENLTTLCHPEVAWYGSSNLICTLGERQEVIFE